MLLTYVGVKYSFDSHAPVKKEFESTLLIWSSFQAIFGAAVPALVALNLYLARKASSLRAIVIMTLLVGLLISLFAMAIRPYRTGVDRALLVAMIGSPPPTAVPFSDRLDPFVNSWRDIQIGFEVVPFGLLGIFLARHKGWKVAAVIAAYISCWVVVVMTSMSGAVNVLYALRNIGWGMRAVLNYWVQIGFQFSALLLLFMLDRAYRRVFQQHKDAQRQ